MPISSNLILRDRAIRHAVYLQRYNAHERQRIMRFLRSGLLPTLDNLIKARITQIGDDPGPDTTARLTQLASDIRRISEAPMSKALDALRSDLPKLATSEAQFAKQVIGGAVPFKVELTLPPPNVLKLMGTDAMVRGSPLEDWWGEIPKKMGRDLKRTIEVGIAGGRSTDQLVRDVEQSQGSTSALRRNTEAIVRTSVAEVAGQARISTLQENSDIVKGWQFVATLDDRTTILCAGLDGSIFAVDDTKWLPPVHINCRSAAVPVLKSLREMGIDSDAELPPGTRESMDGYVPETTDYDTWLRGQPEEVQDEVLGPERAELFRDGMPIHSFSDDEGKTIPLEELQRLEQQDALPEDKGEAELPVEPPEGPIEISERPVIVQEAEAEVGGVPIPDMPPAPEAEAAAEERARVDAEPPPPAEEQAPTIMEAPPPPAPDPNDLEAVLADQRRQQNIDKAGLRKLEKLGVENMTEAQQARMEVLRDKTERRKELIERLAAGEKPLKTHIDLIRIPEPGDDKPVPLVVAPKKPEPPPPPPPEPAPLPKGDTFTPEQHDAYVAALPTGADIRAQVKAIDAERAPEKGTIQARIVELQDRWSALQAKLLETGDPMYVDERLVVERELREIRATGVDTYLEHLKASKDEIHELLGIDPRAQADFRLDTEGVTHAPSVKQANTAAKFLRSIAVSDIETDFKLVEYEKAAKKDGRDCSFALPTMDLGSPVDPAHPDDYDQAGEVVLKPRDAGNQTAVHELGHLIEFANRGARRAVIDFMLKREQGFKQEKLSKLTGDDAYGDTEVASNNPIWNKTRPYAARIYSGTDADSVYRGRSGTEVLSMGVEMLYQNPRHFMEADPEYFDLIVGILRGDYPPPDIAPDEDRDFEAMVARQERAAKRAGEPDAFGAEARKPASAVSRLRRRKSETDEEFSARFEAAKLADKAARETEEAAAKAAERRAIDEKIAAEAAAVRADEDRVLKERMDREDRIIAEREERERIREEKAAAEKAALTEDAKAKAIEEERRIREETGALPLPEALPPPTPAEEEGPLPDVETAADALDKVEELQQAIEEFEFAGDRPSPGEASRLRKLEKELQAAEKELQRLEYLEARAKEKKEREEQERDKAAGLPRKPTEEELARLREITAERAKRKAELDADTERAILEGKLEAERIAEATSPAARAKVAAEERALREATDPIAETEGKLARAKAAGDDAEVARLTSLLEDLAKLSREIKTAPDYLRPLEYPHVKEAKEIAALERMTPEERAAVIEEERKLRGELGTGLAPERVPTKEEAEALAKEKMLEEVRASLALARKDEEERKARRAAYLASLPDEERAKEIARDAAAELERKLARARMVGDDAEVARLEREARDIETASTSEDELRRELERDDRARAEDQRRAEEESKREDLKKEIEADSLRRRQEDLMEKVAALREQMDSETSISERARLGSEAQRLVDEADALGGRAAAIELALEEKKVTAAAKADYEAEKKKPPPAPPALSPSEYDLRIATLKAEIDSKRRDEARFKAEADAAREAAAKERDAGKKKSLETKARLAETMATARDREAGMIASEMLDVGPHPEAGRLIAEAEEARDMHRGIERDLKAEAVALRAQAAAEKDDEKRRDLEKKAAAREYAASVRGMDAAEADKKLASLLAPFVDPTTAAPSPGIMQTGIPKTLGGTDTVKAKWNLQGGTKMMQSIAATVGTTEEEVQADLTKAIKTYTDNARLFKRTKVSAAVAIARDGRFKSQFETGTSDGTFNPALRAQWELDRLGIPKDIPDHLRPQYGYLANEATDNDVPGARSYGDVIFEMKPNLRSRSTVTLDDSLSSTGQVSTVPVPLEDPNHRAFPTGYRTKAIGVLNGTDPQPYATYAEIQMLGGVSLDDVEAVHLWSAESRNAPSARFTDKHQYDELIKLLRSKGIRIIFRTS